MMLKNENLLQSVDFSTISYIDSGCTRLILRQFFENPKRYLYDVTNNTFTHNFNILELLKLTYDMINVCSYL
jgi:hypothetical protein